MSLPLPSLPRGISGPFPSPVLSTTTDPASRPRGGPRAAIDGNSGPPVSPPHSVEVSPAPRPLLTLRSPCPPSGASKIFSRGSRLRREEWSARPRLPRSGVGPGVEAHSPGPQPLRLALGGLSSPGPRNTPPTEPRSLGPLAPTSLRPRLPDAAPAAGPGPARELDGVGTLRRRRRRASRRFSRACATPGTAPGPSPRPWLRPTPDLDRPAPPYPASSSSSSEAAAEARSDGRAAVAPGRGQARGGGREPGRRGPRPRIPSTSRRSTATTGPRARRE